MNNEYKNKMSTWADRREPVKNKKLKPKPDASHLVNYKKVKLYDYYLCDYCGEEIKILEKKQEMTGGTATIPHTVTKRGELKLALCNKCLRPALKEFEEVENAN